MMPHHLVGLAAVAAAFVLPFLTPASRIGLAVVAAVICAGLPLVAELGVIFGATVATAWLNRRREARRIRQAEAAGGAALDAIEEHARRRLSILRHHGD